MTKIKTLNNNQKLTPLFESSCLLNLKGLRNVFDGLILSSLLMSFLIIFFCGMSCQPSEKTIQFLPTPCEQGGESNLHISSSNQPILSWVEYANDSTDALVLAQLKNEKWDTFNIVAYGQNWFVNWADFPSIVSYPNKDRLAAHWLQKSAAGTYDYDIRIAQSMDNGKTWGDSFVLNQDGIAAEHGFVSLVPISETSIFATWLDGRYTKTENGSDGHENGHGGAMTLRMAYIHPDNTITQDRELDNQVCDCCQTSAALTSNGMIVAYRDRLEGEIRDISIVRQVGFDWTQPRRIFEDNWEIAGCPVNGPKIVAEGQRVAIAWFTMARDTAKVQVAFSSNAGASFSEPIRVDEGNPLGRVDLVLIEGGAIVSWLENKSNWAEIKLQKVNKEGRVGTPKLLTKTSPARASGFPILEKLDHQLLLAWTEITDEEEETTIVRTALVEQW